MIRASRRCVTCSQVLPRGRSGINVSNWRIEALACARDAHVLQRAADSGLPAGHSSCPSLSSAALSSPLVILPFRREVRPHGLLLEKSSRTREEGPGPGPDISCAHMQITVPRCNHASIWWSTIIRTIYFFTAPSRKQTHCACFRVHSTYRARCCFPPKTGDRSTGTRFYRATLMTNFLANLGMKFTHMQTKISKAIAIFIATL